MEFLSSSQWQVQAQAHRDRLAPMVEAHLERRKRGQKHPVWDFLWEYYSFKPSHLMTWSPGIGVELEDGKEYLKRKEFSSTTRGVALNKGHFPQHRIEAVREICQLLEATQQRAPRHDCFGLHEWAMVYRAPEIRHPVPLRMGHEELAIFVESQIVRCSHFDAFRFFTPAAIPLNTMNPGSENRADFDQGGCIHANMDLYKWAYKFWPWIGSDIIADAFFVALEARELDMCAAPYDLQFLGFKPIRIETAEGRREYVEQQKIIAQKAAPVRAQLADEYRKLLDWAGSTAMVSEAPSAASF